MIPGPSRDEWETSDRVSDLPCVRSVVSARKENLKTETLESSCGESSVTCETINAKAKAIPMLRLKVISMTSD